MNTLNDSFLACYSPFITPNTPYFLHIFLNNWILNVKTDIDTGARTYLQVIPWVSMVQRVLQYFVLLVLSSQIQQTQVKTSTQWWTPSALAEIDLMWVLSVCSNSFSVSHISPKIEKCICKTQINISLRWINWTQFDLYSLECTINILNGIVKTCQNNVTPVWLIFPGVDRNDKTYMSLFPKNLLLLQPRQCKINDLHTFYCCLFCSSQWDQVLMGPWVEWALWSSIIWTDH